jgi:type IX secretion system PorP/SprF family membrane protein
MKKIILTFAFYCSILSVFGQNQFHIGQYAIYQPFLNPAAVGVYDNVNFALLYKKQWTGLEGSPHLQGFNFNMPLGERKMNFVSFNVLNDKIGLNNSTEISGTYAFKVRPSLSSRLIFGLTASLNLVSSRLSNASIIEANDPVFTTNSPVYPLPNFKFGTYFYRHNFYLGFVIPNILENKVIESNGTPSGFVGFSPQNMHYYLHGGYKFDLKKNNTFVVSALAKDASGAPLQFDLNFNFTFNSKFGLATNLRSSKDVMLIFTAYVMPELMLSYGYEYSFSKLSKYNNGTHEVLLVYKVKVAKDVIAFPRFLY